MKQNRLQNVCRIFAPRGLAVKFLFLSFTLMVFNLVVAASEHSPAVAAHANIYGGLKTALDRFAIDCGRYPTTAEGLNALVNYPTNLSRARWNGPYLDQIPQDPWKHDYVYRCPGIHNTNGYDIYSCGYDGISKSGGDDLDDINNWNLDSPRGGNDFALNYWQVLFYKLSDSLVFQVMLWTLQIILFLGVVRLITSIFSQRVRDSIYRHPTAHIIWFILSLLAIFLLLSSIVPRVSG